MGIFCPRHHVDGADHYHSIFQKVEGWKSDGSCILVLTMIDRRIFVGLVSTLAWAQTHAGATAILDGSWLHSARARTLSWRLVLPSGDGPFPLIVYSPGLGRGRDSGFAWGAAWANAGMAVLHLQHSGSDSQIARNGWRALKSASSADQMIERLLDLRFAITEAVRLFSQGMDPWNRIETDAIGMAGHSFGALAIQAAAGQTYPGIGDLADPRPKAFVALSPSLPIGVNLSAKESFASVNRPFFAVTGSNDASPFPRARPDTQRAGVFEALPVGQRALLWLAGADHGTFGGNTRLPENKALIEESLLARLTNLIATSTALWFRWRLLDDELARRHLLSIDGLDRNDKLLID